MNSVYLENKAVGDGNPCYVIAEIGGAFATFDEAKRLIDTAKTIGIDAIKFQTLEADTITTKNNYFDMEATGKTQQYEIFKHFELSKDLQFEVVNYANKQKIPIFSAPSHMNDLKIMNEMDLQIYKIGSDLACHIPLLKEIAKLDKPIILSTGMCTLDEVRNSVDAIISKGNSKIILMHCISNYPSKIDELNLESINTLKNEFDLPVGYSDHSVGIMPIFSSVVMGSNIVEKHFRDIQNSPGPDDVHSLLQEDFKKLIYEIKNFEKSKGTGEKNPTFSEQKHKQTNRVSIVAIIDIPSNTTITEDMIDIRRPGNGIQPIHYESLLGKKSKIEIKKEYPLEWDMIE
jgi:N,N'-diacetyllegionaminate synthase